MKIKIPISHRTAGIQYAIRDVVVPAQKLEQQGHNIIKLNIGDPLSHKGFSTPLHMIEAYKKALQTQLNGYSPSYGIPDLREAIALDENQKENGGWACSLNDVYITSGVTEALLIIFSTFLEPGDQVLIPGPYYPPYIAYPPIYDGIVKEYKLESSNDWRIDLSDFESKLNEKVKLIVIVNPNNPTGGIVHKKELEKIVQLVSSYPNCSIISDEIYDLYNFENNHISTASTSDVTPVITLNGVSKGFYAPGWRIGYMAIHAPENRLIEIRKGIEQLLRSRLCASTPAQYGYLAGLLEDKSWMNEYKSKLLKHRNYAVDQINKIPGLKTEIPKGSFYMFPKIVDKKYNKDDKKFVLDLLQEEHVLLVHGSGFSKQFGSGHFRIVFIPEIEILEEAFARINRFIN